MPAVFEQAGIRFEYPENWSLDSDTIVPGRGGQVVVASPHTAFWHLTLYPPDMELEPLFDEALRALREEYKEIEVEPAHDFLEDREIESYDVNFIYLDLTNTCWLRGLHLPGATCVLLCQAEDREFERVAPVFQAMLASLIRHSDAPR